MATATVGTSTVVFSNSGAAANLCNTALTEDTLGVICFDVLAASGGGVKTTLYSVDEGTNTSLIPVNNGMTGYNTDLLSKDCIGVKECTANGGKFWIGSDAKIHYDASGIDPALINQVAVGSSFDDTFQYTIRMSNGTLAVGTLTVKITNTNDGPVVTASNLVGDVTEDADGDDAGSAADATQTASGTITFDDADLLDTHTISIVADGDNIFADTNFTADITDPATGAGSGTVSWNYEIDNDLLQSLGKDQTIEEKFTVTITDNHGVSVEQVVTVKVHGINDNPDLDNVDAGTINDTIAVDSSFGDLSGTLVGSDVDTNDTGLLAYAAQGADGFGNKVGTYGTLHVDSDGDWTYTPNAAAIDALDGGETDTDVFTVVISDGHGGSSTATLTVNVNGADEPPAGPPQGNPPANTALDHDTPTDDATDVPGGATETIIPTTGGGRNSNGTTGDDVIQGNSADQTIGGNQGNDIIYGGTGGDQLNGGPGNDILYGQEGVDNLNGGSGNDTLFGGSGNDQLTGSGDSDTLVGGSGADTFVFGDGDSVLPGDTIIGFDNSDKIDLTGIDADTTLLNDQAFLALTTGTTVSAHSLNYYFDAVSGDTILQGDTDGVTGTVELQITLQDINALLTTGVGGNLLL